MTVPFLFNMARGRVMPPEARKRWYIGLFWYLGIVGVAIVAVVYYYATVWSGLKFKEELLAKSERAFLSQHDGASKTPDVAGDFRARMSDCAEVLDAGNRFIGSGRRATDSLLAVTRLLPGDIYVGDFESSADRLAFSVCVPVERRNGNDFVPPRMLAVLNKDPGVKTSAGEIEARSSQKQRIGGVEVNVWRFESGGGK